MGDITFNRKGWRGAITLSFCFVWRLCIEAISTWFNLAGRREDPPEPYWEFARCDISQLQYYILPSTLSTLVACASLNNMPLCLVLHTEIEAGLWWVKGYPDERTCPRLNEFFHLGVETRGWVGSRDIMPHSLTESDTCHDGKDECWM